MLAYKKGDPNEPEIFAKSHYNLYYQGSLRQLFEIDCIILWKKMSILNQIFRTVSGEKSQVMMSTSKHLRISQ